MSVPAKTNPKWSAVVTGKQTYALKFLAAKIMLGRLIRSANSPQAISAAVDELHALYTQNIAVPSAKEDMKTIFG